MVDLFETPDSYCVKVTETNSFRGIPYADYFSVNTSWQLVCDKEGPGMGDSCSVSGYFDVVFHKSTWLQSTIESNTKAELTETFNLWLSGAKKELSLSAGRGAAKDIIAMVWGRGPAAPAPELSPLAPSVAVSAPVATHGESSYAVTVNEDEDDTEFHDCEEGDLLRPERRRSVLRYDRSYSSFVLKELGSGTPATHEAVGRQQQVVSMREFSINAIDTFIVLVEFSLWQVRLLFQNEMRFFFDISLDEVRRRARNIVVPGRQGPLMARPDLYGPVVAIFVLPQVLILSIGGARHGCNQSSLLGNAVVMSIFIWLALALFYRLLAYLIAPAMQYKHCLCLIGYSYYAWSLALLLSYPLEALLSLFGARTSLLLILVGVPAALAQGYVFVEYSQLAVAAPRERSVQQLLMWLQQHRRLVLLLPKLLLCLVVVLTHYQFFMYIARVFLPGRKQLCELSALLDPAHYRDIITQKEVRQYASKIIDEIKHRL